MDKIFLTHSLLLLFVIGLSHTAPSKFAEDKQKLSNIIRDLEDTLKGLQADINDIEMKEEEPTTEAEISETETQAKIDERDFGMAPRPEINDNIDDLHQRAENERVKSNNVEDGSSHTNNIRNMLRLLLELERQSRTGPGDNNAHDNHEK